MGFWPSVLRRLFPGRRPKGPIETIVPCDFCQKDAATLTFVPHGAPVGEESSDAVELRVEGFLHDLVATVETKRRRLAKAVRNGDVRTIYRHEPLWAPFYCPECHHSFCRGHWTTDVVHGDDHPGWAEETAGRCPFGHVRVLER